MGCVVRFSYKMKGKKRVSVESVRGNYDRGKKQGGNKGKEEKKKEEEKSCFSLFFFYKLAICLFTSL